MIVEPFAGIGKHVRFEGGPAQIVKGHSVLLVTVTELHCARSSFAPKITHATINTMAARSVAGAEGAVLSLIAGSPWGTGKVVGGCLLSLSNPLWAVPGKRMADEETGHAVLRCQGLCPGLTHSLKREGDRSARAVFYGVPVCIAIGSWNQYS